MAKDDRLDPAVEEGDIGERVVALGVHEKRFLEMQPEPDILLPLAIDDDELCAGAPGELGDQGQIALDVRRTPEQRRHHRAAALFIREDGEDAVAFQDGHRLQRANPVGRKHLDIEAAARRIGDLAMGRILRHLGNRSDRNADLLHRRSHHLPIAEMQAKRDGRDLAQVGAGRLDADELHALGGGQAMDDGELGHQAPDIVDEAPDQLLDLGCRHCREMLPDVGAGLAGDIRVDEADLQPGQTGAEIRDERDRQAPHGVMQHSLQGLHG
jgi:hypothetical protein